MTYRELVIMFAGRTSAMKDAEALSFLAICFLKLIYLMYNNEIISKSDMLFIIDSE